MPPFVIFCLPRTGSYHLISLLGSAPDIVCHGEAFKAGRIELQPAALAAIGFDAGDVARRNADPIGFAERLRSLSTPSAIVGFKLFVNHVVAHKGVRRTVLLAPAWRKLILRRDPVRTYASRLRAEQTGVWTLPVGQSRASDVLHAPVRFDEASFDKHVQEHEKFLRFASEATAVSGNPVLWLDYDDMVRGEGLGAALRFVGSTAAPESLGSSMQRQYIADFRAGFSNWPEFEAHLVGRGIRAPVD